MAITDAIVIIDNTQPYFFLNEKNIVQFYVQNLDTNTDISKVNCILKDAVTGKEIFNSTWVNQSPLPVSLITNENNGITSMNQKGPYECIIDLSTMIIIPTNENDLTVFLSHPLLLTLALVDEQATSAYSNGVLKTILYISNTVGYISQNENGSQNLISTPYIGPNYWPTDDSIQAQVDSSSGIITFKTTNPPLTTEGEKAWYTYIIATDTDIVLKPDTTYYLSKQLILSYNNEFDKIVYLVGERYFTWKAEYALKTVYYQFTSDDINLTRIVKPVIKPVADIDVKLLYPNNYYYFNFEYITSDLDSDALLSASYELSVNNEILQTVEKTFIENTEIWSIPIQAKLLEKAIDNQTSVLPLQFTINFTTVKGYSDTKVYNINITYDKNVFFDTLFTFSKITATADSNKGVNKISILLNKANNNITNESLTGHLQLFRKDLTANHSWELVQEITATLDGINDVQGFILEDIIAEPGKPYLYQATFYRQYFDGDTQSWITKYLNNTINTKEPVILLTDDIFLITKKGILRIAYNPELTQYRRNMVDQVTTTIGGAYPFVTRNGKQRHRTFSLGGLLSYNREKIQLYEAKEIKNYDSFAGNNETYLPRPIFESVFTQLPDAEYYKNLPNSNKEIVYEKEFRERVMDFLYSDNIMLFKSLQEGNIIVRLIGVSMTPNAQLNRNIYSFTSQAVEVMDNSVENCYNYFVIHPEAHMTISYEGQEV